jgi:MFS family permease
VDNVALVFLIRDELGGGAAAYGTAMAIFGVGMVSATALVARNSARWRSERLLTGSFLSTGVSTAMLAAAPSVPFVYAAQFVGGGSNGIDVAAQTTLVQERAPAAMLGRMSGALNTAVAVGFLIAYLGGGLLVDITSPRTAFWIAAAGTFAAVFVLRPVWRSAPPRAQTSPQP